MSQLGWAIADVRVAAWRNVMKLIRIPALFVFSIVQPVMFVLLFRYVFGGAVQGLPEGVNYVSYLLPGIFVQTSIFGASNTGIGLAEDMASGIVDRFRSLPMARSAVLLGRTLADLVRNIGVVILLAAVGYLVGFRFQNGPLPAVAVLALTALIGFSFSWVTATIGLALRSLESVQAASFIWVFPLTFISSIFVPPAGMPAVLQAVARNNPVTIWADTLRTLTLGDGYLRFIGSSATLTELLAKSFAWIAGITLCFAFLAVRRYRTLT